MYVTLAKNALNASFAVELGDLVKTNKVIQ